MRHAPSRERVRELFHFEPSTGVFTRKIATTNSVKIGDVAGTKTAGGYLAFHVDGFLHHAHRIAWLYVYGDWPADMGFDIDHVDGDRANNRIANLRVATRSQNNVNSVLRKNNSSGLRGVSWCKRTGRWQVYINVDRKMIFLGRFASKEEALDARKRAAKNYYGEFSRREQDAILV